MARSRTDNPLIADRYATALFALAEGKTRDAVESDLDALAQAIRADQSVQELLAHPLLSRSAKAEAMKTLLTSKKANALTIDAVVKIAEAGRLTALPEIADAFAAKSAEARGEVIAVVTSATALAKKDVDALIAAIEKATEMKVRVMTREDASLLGGVKVKLGAKEMDMSLAGNLERMRRALLDQAA